MTSKELVEACFDIMEDNIVKAAARIALDTEADIKRIVDFGGKISLETAQILLNHLKED